MRLAELPTLVKPVISLMGQISCHLKPLDKALHVKTIFL